MRLLPGPDVSIVAGRMHNGRKLKDMLMLLFLTASKRSPEIAPKTGD